MSAQVETFDIATFVRPRGWSRAESNGILVLQDRKVIEGRVTFCQIYLFPSRSSNASPAVDFQMEWEAKVVQSLGVQVRPSPEMDATPDGWTILTAHADFVRQGMQMRTILSTGTGFGMLVNVMVTVSAYSYQTELEEFFKNLNLIGNFREQVSPGQSAQAAGTKPSYSLSSRSVTAGGGDLAGYVYTTPPGWTLQKSQGGIELMSPMYNTGERCVLTMLPMRPSSRPLADDAIDTFRELFKTDPLSTYPAPPPRLTAGTSPQGWEYFTIKKLVGGQEGDARTMGAILLLAKLGGQVATIVGRSKDFMVSNCFGLRSSDTWPMLFYSLQFNGAQPSGQTLAAVPQSLVGSWSIATASIGSHYMFNARGRYASTAATRHESQDTQAFFGDGAYSVDGNTLVLKSDSHGHTTHLFRVEQLSVNSGQSWQYELCLMDPGSTGEVCYRKE